MSGLPSASASLTSILTAVQNVATAINNAAQTYLNVQGARNLANVTSATLVKNGSGRVVSISVITAGTTTGLIYDSNNLNSLLNPVYVIPEAVALDPYVVNIPVGLGIVIVPGTGQKLAVVYS